MTKTLTLFAILTSVILVAGTVGFVISAPDAFAALEPEPDRKKVTICHIPPGNPNNPQTITVSVNALQAHLAHGDTLGPCDFNTNNH